MDLIDLSIVTTTEDGQTDTQEFKRGFKDVCMCDKVLMVPAPTTTQPKSDTPDSGVTDKPKSKYQTKRQKPAETPADHQTSVSTKKTKDFTWRDKHDDEDAIPDSELNPRARARRKQLEERAEAQAFAGYMANKGGR
jgi:hypothetical protein